jgi:hypothetical protein
MLSTKRARLRRLGQFETLERRCPFAADFGTQALGFASLEGRVWVEQSANLRFDAGDRPLAGVHLHLANEHGQVVATAQTSADGSYRFESLFPGTYALTEIQPSRTAQGADFAGSQGGAASGGNRIEGILLAAGAAAIDYNFLELAGDSVSPLDGNGAPPLTSQGNIVPALPETGPSPEPTTEAHSEPVGVPADLTFLIFPAPLQPPGQLPESGTQPLPIDSLVAPAPPELQPAPATTSSAPLIGGGKSAATWELTLIEREEGESLASGLIASQSRRTVTPLQDSLQRGVWFVPRLIGEQVSVQEVVFGRPGALPVVGDFDADGQSDLALYIDGQWLVRTGSEEAGEGVRLLGQLAPRGGLPVAGDWDGNGRTDIGVFRGVATNPQSEASVTRRLHLRTATPTGASPGRFSAASSSAFEPLPAKAVDQVLRFGTGSDQPVAGDWNGNGIAQIGAFRSGVWRIDLDGDGRFSSGDREFSFGAAGDQPVVGDFNGDGLDEVGVYRRGTWILDTNGNQELDDQDLQVAFGQAGDSPVVGDWDGDGCDEPGLYRASGPVAAEQQADLGDLPLFRYLSGGA